jgi:hypothetical protein
MVIVRITTTMNDREAEQVNWPSDAARADAINVRRSCSLPAALGFGGAPIRRRPGGGRLHPRRSRVDHRHRARGAIRASAWRALRFRRASRRRRRLARDISLILGSLAVVAGGHDASR